jgi:hypothetical protein
MKNLGLFAFFRACKLGFMVFIGFVGCIGMICMAEPEPIIIGIYRVGAVLGILVALVKYFWPVTFGKLRSR